MVTMTEPVAEVVERARRLASMIELGEKLSWGTDTQALRESADLLERLSRERDTGVPEIKTALGIAHAALTAHNDWHLKQIEPQTIDGMEIVPADAYCDSTLYELTQDALHHVERMEAKLSAAPQPPTVSTQGDMLIPMGRENDGDKHVTAYMCLIDFECELGLASGGNRVYPSIEDIREHSKCVGGCGIVEVEVRATRVVQEPSDEGELVMTAAEIEAAEHSPPSPQPDLSTLTRERDQAREALEPFATFGERNVDENGWKSNIHREQISTWFGPSDFRRARSVLHPEEGQIDSALSAAPAPEAVDGERS